MATINSSKSLFYPGKRFSIGRNSKLVSFLVLPNLNGKQDQLNYIYIYNSGLVIFESNVIEICVAHVSQTYIQHNFS